MRDNNFEISLNGSQTEILAHMPLFYANSHFQHQRQSAVADWQKV
jgi:hypothetical protein